MKFSNKLFLLIILIPISLTLLSSGAGSDYVFRLGEKGWIYYIFSSKMSSCLDTKNPKNIEYDYTYVEIPDSVSMLTTIKIKDAYKPYMTIINSCDISYKIYPEIIYANPKGSDFIFRLKNEMPFEIWEKMYDCDKPFTITFKFLNVNDTINYHFRIDNKKWGKEKIKIQNVQHAINMTKGV